MDYLAIIERIEARLKVIKMGKMEFYEKMDISPNSYSLWKKGETKPTNENLEKAATIFGCDLKYLMFGEIEKAPTLASEDLTDEQIELVKLFRGADSAYQAAALALLREAEAAHKVRDDESKG